MENENNIEQIEQETPPAQPEGEPTQPNVYETIIAQQQAQIDALIKQSNTLTQQITNLVQNGAQLNAQPVQPEPQPQQAQGFNPKSLAETDAYLNMEDLAKEIGKR